MRLDFDKWFRISTKISTEHSARMRDDGDENSEGSRVVSSSGSKPLPDTATATLGGSQ
jgi:hypothetical protein